MSEPSPRLRQSELSKVFLSALGEAVLSHDALDTKPLEVDLGLPHPMRTRVYLYNATYPPGGRTLGERKIQLIVPNQPRGQRGDLDHSGGRIVLLVGYEEDVKVFVLWDAGIYRNFSYSMNVQVNAETIFSAFAGQIAEQRRIRRTPVTTVETVVCTRYDRLVEAISLRLRLSLDRLTGDSQ
jgi:hypothetical protein